LLWAGELTSAKDSIQTAIDYDEANDYDPSLHYLYRSQILIASGQEPQRIRESIGQTLESAKKRENAYVMVFSSIE
jgi:hypothetical protein